MVTVTLHDGDAAEVLRYLCAVGNTYQPPERNVKLGRAAEAFKCALLLCDCDQSGEKGTR
jgi:hypothetical protein